MGTRSPKAMTVRLDWDQAKMLELIARTEGESLNDAIREAVQRLIDERARDERFRQRVQAVIKEDQAALEQLMMGSSSN